MLSVIIASGDRISACIFLKKRGDTMKNSTMMVKRLVRRNKYMIGFLTFVLQCIVWAIIQ